MGKRGKGRQGDTRNPKRRATAHTNGDADDMMDDEIDAFHKQRDIVPLDINDDLEASEEDNEHPVLDFKNDGDSDDEDEDEYLENDTHLAKKIIRQQKFLRGRIGGVEDEMNDGAEDVEENKAVWGRRRESYYDSGKTYESDDEELPAEEEAEVLRLQREKAQKLALEDFGLEDVSEDENEGEPRMEEILLKGKASEKVSHDGEKNKVSHDREKNDDDGTTYEEVKKDLSALSKEELMDVVYSSAPELVGLLSELSDALKELENKVDPLLSKLKEVGNTKSGNLHYMEVKRLLLLAYCQVISFYLLLKSEGQPIRDHPVIARLVEIKNLLEKMKQLDANLPAEIEDILSNKYQSEGVKLAEESTAPVPEPFTENGTVPAATEVVRVLPREAVPAAKVKSSKDGDSKGRKHNHTNDQVGIQSMQMLKVRAVLEEKLKQKGLSGPISAKGDDKVQKHHQPVNGKLATLDDFGDEANATSQGGNKLSKLVVSRMNKPKAISGDDDLPERDDIGERRRKHELRVLGRVGITSGGEDLGEEPRYSENRGHSDAETAGSDPESGSESEDDVYEQVKLLRDAKIAAKQQMYSRTPMVAPLDEEIAEDGKRHISYQMEKNRGLTRARKKLTKNPRKKYKLKHQKAVVRRKGQVRDIRKPSGQYGGEESGINKNISKSIRF